jgi:hypothetical protein
MVTLLWRQIFNLPGGPLRANQKFAATAPLFQKANKKALKRFASGPGQFLLRWRLGPGTTPP